MIRAAIVEPGDTLSGIAQTELGSAAKWRELAVLNNLTNPHMIRPGQVIKLDKGRRRRCR